MLRKHLRFILMLSILVLPALALAEESGQAEYNELSTAADAASVLRIAYGMEEGSGIRPSVADVTGNLSVTRADATAILMRATERLRSYSDLAGAVEDTLLGEEYLEKFSYTGPIETATGYRSEKVAIELHTFYFEKSKCFYADIYVRDITCLKTAFAGGRYRGNVQRALQMCSDNGGLIAITGDMYTRNAHGSIVRNGVWYNESAVSKYKDIGVLYSDGTFATFPRNSITEEELKASGDIWQMWVFGPELLDENGEMKTTFNSSLGDVNPRSAFGYYSPGHYCFLVVDGRQSGYSKGVTLSELSEIMHTLGCKKAYNLDGGGSATMVNSQKVLNKPCAGGRLISDIIYIGEPLSE